MLRNLGFNKYLFENTLNMKKGLILSLGFL